MNSREIAVLLDSLHAKKKKKKKRTFDRMRFWVGKLDLPIKIKDLSHLVAFYTS